jgi:hypothetical protein
MNVEIGTEAEQFLSGNTSMGFSLQCGLVQILNHNRLWLDLGEEQEQVSTHQLQTEAEGVDQAQPHQQRAHPSVKRLLSTLNNYS